MTTPPYADLLTRDQSVISQLSDEVAVGTEVRAAVHLANNGVLSGEVLESFWERYEEISSWPCLEVLLRLLQNHCGTEQPRKKRQIEWWSATFKEQLKFCGKRVGQEF